ncbi:gem-associated protein 5 [Holotrichia oblita]|uniref:Gem-associated protein 5 n=1 Tax=Holotrichia oblita TaxID=644536 RepID=A0ACB9T9E5_HOLOL|nr:gem-associated protein 5 [Holotrichia oblita]
MALLLSGLTLTNEVNPLKNVFPFKVQITTLAVCPHSPWLVAFGVRQGLVIITDLRKNGKILYKMRGHDKSIISLSWCPVPYNVFPRNTIKRITDTKKHNGESIEPDADTSKSEIKEDNNEETNLKKNINEEIDIKDVTKEVGLQEHAKEVDVKEKVTKDVDSKENIHEKLDLKDEVENVLQNNIEYDTLTDIINNKELDNIQNSDLKIKSSDADTILSSDCVEKIIETSKTVPIENQEQSVKLYLEQTDKDIQDLKLEKENDNHNNSKDQLLADDKTITDIKLEEENKHKCIADDTCDTSVIVNEENNMQQSDANDIVVADTSQGEENDKQATISDSSVTADATLKEQNDNKPTAPPVDEVVAPNVVVNEENGDIKVVDALPDFTKLPKEYLLASSAKGGNTPQKKLIHHDHGSNLFSIAAPIHVIHKSEEHSNDSKEPLFAWTFGQERFLLCTSLQADRTTFSSYPTNGGYIYCLASSPLDPNRLAVGIGDNTAKIWDLSRSHVQCIIMTNLWQKIQSKVLTLAWHPTKESILAYGTLEGRIGLVNTNNTSKLPSLLTQHFRSSVNSISWGPLDGKPNVLGLYACGEEQLAIYNVDKPTEGKIFSFSKPTIMQIGKNERVSCISWKPDYKLFAVGTRSGSIAIYNINLELESTIYAQHKRILNLSWHPEATAEDSETSPYHSWLAVSTLDVSIIIYDLTKERGSGDDSKDDCRLFTILNGHTKPVNCLCWSSYEGAKLVSAGEDGIAQVWDVKNKKIISTFTGHNVEAILSVLWSPLDKDFIITGAKDNCIRIWNITENKPMSEEELTVVRKERLRLKQEFRKHKQADESDSEDDIKKVKRGVMLTLTAKAQNNPSKVFEACKRSFSFNNSEQQENTVKSEDNSNVNDFDVTKLFGDKDDLLELLETEQQHHVDRKKYVCCQQLSLWKGDFAETLKEAIKNGTVNPWLISMAPMVSPKLWQEACEVYATKLLEKTKVDPIETVSYLIACHKVEEAIKVLCTATLFRDALALAKCRYSKDDPIINEILSKWATFSILTGSFELAAQCFIAMEQYDEAAKALFKRSDEKTLEFALRLAEKSDNKDLTDAILLRYNVFKTHAVEKENNTKVYAIDESHDIHNNGTEEYVTSNKTDVNNSLNEDNVDKKVVVESNEENNETSKDDQCELSNA